VLLEFHGFVLEGVPEPVSCEVALIQVLNIPVIVGFALIATLIVVLEAHVGADADADVGVKV
jgi:hypothetical protein